MHYEEKETETEQTVEDAIARVSGRKRLLDSRPDVVAAARSVWKNKKLSLLDKDAVREKHRKERESTANVFGSYVPHDPPVWDWSDDEAYT